MLLPAPGLPGHSNFLRLLRLEASSLQIPAGGIAAPCWRKLRCYLDIVPAEASRCKPQFFEHPHLSQRYGLKLDGFPSKGTRVAPYGFPFKTPICAKPSCGVKILLALVMYCFDCLLMDPRRGGRAPLRGFKPIGSRNVPLAFLGWAPQNGARVFSFWLP